MANISQLFRRQSSRQDSLCRSLSRNRSEKGEIEGEGPASVEQQQQQSIWQHKRRRGFQGKINPQDAKDQMEMTSLMWEHRPKYADIASGKRKVRRKKVSFMTLADDSFRLEHNSETEPSMIVRDIL